MNLVKNNLVYRQLLLSSIVNNLGTSLYNIVFIVYASTLPNPQLMISIATIIAIIPPLLNMKTGELADKTRRKDFWIINSKWLQAILFVVLSALLSKKLFIIFCLLSILNIISDLLGQYGDGLKISMIRKNVDGKELQEAFGVSQGVITIVQIIGQSLGAALLKATNQSFSIIALVNVFLFVCSAILLYVVKNKLTFDFVEETEKIEKMNPFSKTVHCVNGMRTIFTNAGEGNFKVIFLSILSINMIAAGIGPLFDIVLLSHPFFPVSFATNILIINVSLMSGMVLGSFIVNDYFKEKSIHFILICSTLILLGVSLSGWFQWNGVVPCILLFLISYLSAKLNPKINSLLVSNLPVETLATTTGLIGALFMVTIPIGSALFVLLANVLSYQTVYIILFVLSSIVLAVLFAFRNHKSKEVQVANDY